MIFVIAWFVLSADQVNASEQTGADGTGCTVRIPVAIQNTPGTVVIESGEEGTPMPEQTELQLGMNETKAFEEIRYDQPEDYHYRIYQKAGQQEQTIYDQTIFDVTVRVIRLENGMLTAELWCQNEGKEEKADKIIFINTRKNETIEREPVKTPGIRTTSSIITKHKTVKTGDMAPIGMLIALAGISAGTMTAIAKWKKKQEK